MTNVLPFRRRRSPRSKAVILAIIVIVAVVLIGKMAAYGVFGGSGYLAFVTIAGLTLAAFIIKKTGA